MTILLGWIAHAARRSLMATAPAPDRQVNTRHTAPALFVDLADLHHNSADGVHVASTGGVWTALAFGFGGFRDHKGQYTFDPRLPEGWDALSFRLTLRGSRMRVTVESGAIRFRLETGGRLEVSVRGALIVVEGEEDVVVPLEGHGPRITGTPTVRNVTGEERPDGSVLTASIPTISTDIE